MISKEEYKWLERHTDILNIVPNIDDYAHEFVKFKVYRPSHIQKIKEIFKNYKCTSGQNKKDIWIKINGFTLNSLNETAYHYFGDMIYDCSDHGIYFMPTNKRRNQRILRKASPRLLENLSNRKKLDILFSYAQTIFPTEQQRLHQNEFIDQNSEKFQALLQLKISSRFMENEYQKVRQIVSKIASLPDIKNKLENFHSLPEKEQRFILNETSRITAEVNNVKPPKIHYLSQKQINNDEQVAEWTQADAYADYKDIYLNKDFFKKYNGIECLNLAFHETTHIAQSNVNYPEFPEMEELFSHRLDYLQNHAETYLSIPTELVTYNLEQYFRNKVSEKLNILSKEAFYASEYTITQQYMKRALHRAY